MANTSLNQGQMLINSPQNAVDIKQLTTILFHRRYLILGISCAVMSVASILALIAKPTYQSSMQILVSSNLYEGVRSSNVQGNPESEFTDPNFQVVDYTAQLKLMMSTKLIQKAVDLLRPTYRDITLEDIKGKKEKGEKPPLEVAQIEGGSGINKIPSQVFEVTFKDKDPIKAQKVLQALQNVYQDYNIEQQNERLHKGLSFVNARLPEIKKEVSQSEKNLEAFRRQHNLLDPEVQSKILLESLADIQKQLETTRAQLQDNRARQANLERKMAASSQNAIISSRLSQSTRYQGLLNEIQKTELALAQQRLRYTENSPVIQNLTQQRQSLLALLRQEAGRSVGEKGQNVANTRQPLLTQGQMVGVDLKLVEEVIQVQTTSLGLIANEKSLVESEQRLRSELSKYPALIAQYNRLLPEVETNRKTLEQLLQAQQSLGLKIAQGGFDWQVLEAPDKGMYMGSGRVFLLGGGIIIGPILGIVAALIWEMFHDVIYSARELQRLTNLRLLGTVPGLGGRARKRLAKLPWDKQDRAVPLVLESNPRLPYHENLDMVYQNIQIARYPQLFQSLMLTSTLAGEGKTTLSLGLAVSAAHMHRRVLLIDANLHNPSLHKILELPNDWGLSLLLEEEANTPVADYIQPIHPDIDVLTAGPTPEDTVKLLSSDRMKELIELFEQTYDLVLIDAPAILDNVDARIVASVCSGIVLVGRIGQITQSELIQAREILSRLNLIGIIANDAKDAPRV
ncbi:MULTISPECIES: GumC family protein [unclassified Tolypothrix]|uniref:GumC family protein n=1 Tax=unclassified Tolypothrix TaxID=2649714 RepID=UPI0005EAADEE|nr:MULTISPECIES: polysaccharide biosynthesis tyrosine autokinase [unclassified Tolypothrix]BAY92946.1 lipopolysaccharide biosynthesis protein [Microchaete diplosiphon NIES-3275]EKF03055.1 putative lipopolysaccharide biosynthesis protein [Tolypothrix sp. PCC 7601]MBE9083096.1 polysaccharide biosynthesis tyrosine autokinase [Tolypothrix sp. LEGE 11397]UYD26844.1 polysaccharide biosynthesis tyrosine autokinase [Tolypothrix sp. PCC 7712]UYD37298.1 polysaccharide biosynthesis tyrosine autokinase [T